MGFWTDFSSIGLNLKPIFSGFETRSKVRQADIQLRTMKEDLIDTKLSLDLAPMQNSN
jgi:outer membrane protein TolC